MVVLEGQGCRELSTLPIATVNVMATNNHDQNCCHNHIHSGRDSDIWHYCCAESMGLSNDGCVNNLTCYQLCPKSMPNRCFVKNVAIVSWMGSYVTIALIAKTMLFPKEKAWIGFPIIVINAKQSDVYLNKPSPTGNGRNPYANDEPQTMWAWNPIFNDRH